MTTQTRVRAILVSAQAVIEDPKQWVTEYEAVAADGGPRNGRDLDACRWCAVGAVLKCASSDEYILYCSYPGEPTIVSKTLQALNDAARYLFETIDDCTHNGITAINDYEGHARTLQMFDRAIAQVSAPPVTVNETDIPF